MILFREDSSTIKIHQDKYFSVISITLFCTLIKVATVLNLKSWKEEDKDYYGFIFVLNFVHK